MQGEDPAEQDTSCKSNAGIDVSKSWLDTHVLPCGSTRRVANTPEGRRELKRWLMQFDLHRVALEATGKWHRPMLRSLVASAIAVAVVDPYRVRHFAKAQGILAKTDRLDARVLAMFAAMMDPAVRAPAPQALEDMQELLCARDSALTEQTSLKNQLAAATGSFLRRQLARRIAALTKNSDALEREIVRRIKADEGLAHRYAILLSIPGIGPINAATLVACMIELGTITGKQASKLAGLAPLADQSAEREGRRVIWGGRAHVRRKLYLAAVTAINFNADMRAFYKRLIAAGKEPKLALIAVARKLLVLANTLITENRMWLPQAPKSA